jgi:hypothetical protein
MSRQMQGVMSRQIVSGREPRPKPPPPRRKADWRATAVGSRSALVSIAVALCVALSIGIVIGRLVGSADMTAERRLVEARAFELMTRTLVPGSPLACLDATAAEIVEGHCENALFATAETTAAAVSFVAAQLALLAASKDHKVQHAGAGQGFALAQMRRNAELDRFGIVAHVLSVKEGCTANRCEALAMLNDTRRVRANLAEHAFDGHVGRHATAWVNSADRMQVASPPAAAAPQAAPAPIAAAKPPSNYYLPSASSIPAVSIMSPEPAGPSYQEATASGEPSSRKSPARASASPNTSASASPTTGSTANTGSTRASGPLQLAPGGQ